MDRWIEIERKRIQVRFFFLIIFEQIKLNIKLKTFI